MRPIKCKLLTQKDQTKITTINVRLTPEIGHVIAIEGRHQDKVLERFATVRFIVRGVTHCASIDKGRTGAQSLLLDVTPLTQEKAMQDHQDER